MNSTGKCVKVPGDAEQGPLNQGDEAEKVHREADPMEPIVPIDGSKPKAR